MPERKRYKGARVGALAVALSAALLAVPGAASANVTASVNGAGALSVSSDAGDAIDITCVGTPGNVKVNGLDPAGGPAACSAITSIPVEGGPDANAINLNGVTDELFTGLTSVTVNGNGGNDVILGSEINDVLNGGDGNDRVVGFRNAAPTRDVMAGGEGDDTLVWNNGDGSDTMDGQNGNDTIEVNGGAAAEQFTVAPSATNPGRISFDRVNPGPFNLDIGTTENLQLNAGGGNDEIKGAKGLAGLIVSSLSGDDDNDEIKGTDGEDLLSGGNGFDVIRSRDQAEDHVDCGRGFDVAFVDRRDFVRGCEVVLGGKLRVKLLRKAVNVAGGAAAVPLRCVVAKRCKGSARLRLKGKTLGGARFNIGRKKAKTIRVKLSRRGRRLMAGASSNGLRVQLRIDATDTNGNGWRTTPVVKLK